MTNKWLHPINPDQIVSKPIHFGQSYKSYVNECRRMIWRIHFFDEFTLNVIKLTYLLTQTVKTLEKVQIDGKQPYMKRIDSPN